MNFAYLLIRIIFSFSEKKRNGMHLYSAKYAEIAVLQKQLREKHIR